MKNIQSILIAFAAILLISSCKTLVDDKKIGQTNDAVTLFGFLNPEHDSITIALNLIEGLSKNKTLTITQQNLKDAVVTLEHNGNHIQLQYIETSGQQGGWNTNKMLVFYAPNGALPILPGETYTVRAHNEGLFDLTSTTTVPNNNFDFDFDIEGPYKVGQWDEEYKVRLKIDEPENESNFYRVYLLDSSNVSIGMNYPIYDAYFDDKNKKDQKLTHDFTLSTHQARPMVLSILSVTESIYRYAKSIENGGGDTGNPFAEPTTIYTNISGGHGVFGAQIVKEKPIF